MPALGVLMPLAEAHTEILFTGGLDTKAHTEAQDPASSFVQLDGVKFGQLGRHEKAAAIDTDYVVSLPQQFTTPWGRGYDFGLALMKRGKELVTLGYDHGLARIVTDQYITSVWENFRYLLGDTDMTTAAGATTNRLSACPAYSSVSRRILYSTQGGRTSQGILAMTACGTPSGYTVVAWIEKSVAADDRFVMAAFTPTGVMVSHQVERIGSLTTGTPTICCCPYGAGGIFGAVISICLGTGAAPFTITAYLWDDDAESFENGATTLTANALFVQHKLKRNHAGTGFLFIYNDNTTGFMRVEDRTLGAITSTHNATASMVDADAIVASTTAIVSIAGGGAGTAHVEKLGTPGTRLTLKTAGAGETLLGITAAAESRSAYTLCGTAFITILDANVNAQYMTEAVAFEWDGGMTTLKAGKDIDNAIPTGNAVTLNGRCYVPIGTEQYASSGASGPGFAGSMILARPAIDANSSYEDRIDAVARFGHDRACYNIGAFLTPNTNFITNDKVHVVHLADISSLKTPATTNKLAQTIMWSTIDVVDVYQGDAAVLDRGAPPSYVEQGGALIFATGMLHDYDGIHCTEAQPLRAPALFTSSTGTVSVKGVYTWVDARGRLHRSAPSEAVTVTNAGTATVYVEKPALVAFDGVTAPELTVELYCTTAGGSIYYLATDSGGYRDVHDSSAAGDQYWVFTNVQPGVATSPPLYTTGGELESEPPPAMHHIAIVGDRIWGVDAEDRTRVWFTKPFVAGYAPEWNTACTLVVPEECEAIADAGGVPTIFGKSAVWQVYGEGPNANNVGSFAPARRIAEIGCSTRASVCKTPYGVVFMADRGFVLLSNAGEIQEIGLQVEPLFARGSYAPRRVVYDEREDELRLTANDDEYTYSFRHQAWTHIGSPHGTLDLAVLDGTVYKCRYASGGYVSTEQRRSATSSTENRSCVWTTPWFKLEGIAGFGRLWRILIPFAVAANVASGAAVEIDVYYDFESSYTDRFNYSWTEIQNWSDVQTVKLDPSKQRLRAVKLKISTLGNHNGILPLSVRYEYGVDRGGDKRQGANSAVAVTVAG
jgi:hypothetical protein